MLALCFKVGRLLPKKIHCYSIQIISAAALYPPQIHDDFPAVFPKSPRLGQTITIECLAYGRCAMVFFPNQQ